MAARSALRGRARVGSLSVRAVVLPPTKSTDGARFIECVDAGVELTTQLYREVLSPSFRPGELEQEDALVAGLTTAGGNSIGAMATSADGEILGGLVAQWFGTSRVLLATNLAIRPELRGRGLGSRLMEFAVPRWIRRFDPRLVLAEIEDPRWYEGDHEHGDPRARMLLYERLGGRALPIDHFLPALTPGSSRVLHLLLLCFFARGDVVLSPGHVDGAAVEGFLAEYFSTYEGDFVDGPRRALMESCRVAGGLALIRPSDLVTAGRDA